MTVVGKLEHSDCIGSQRSISAGPGLTTMVKAKIQDSKGVPPDQQRLLFAGNDVGDTGVVFKCLTLANYSVESKS